MPLVKTKGDQNSKAAVESRRDKLMKRRAKEGEKIKDRTRHDGSRVTTGESLCFLGVCLMIAYLPENVAAITDIIHHMPKNT